MPGENNLETLIKNMRPELNPGEYVFCTLDSTINIDHLAPLGWFRENEGITLILPKAQADEFALPYSFISAWITLKIHSALEAVGLTAVVSQALAHTGISCNMVAAYFHDHIFVPAQDAGRAMEVLQNLKIASKNSNTQRKE